MTTLKISNCDKTQKLKLWLKLKNCHTLIFLDKSQKLELWQKWRKNQIKTKLKKKNFYDKTKKLKLWRRKKISLFLVRTTWQLDNRWDVLWEAFCNLPIFFGRGATICTRPDIQWSPVFGSFLFNKTWSQLPIASKTA